MSRYRRSGSRSRHRRRSRSRSRHRRHHDRDHGRNRSRSRHGRHTPQRRRERNRSNDQEHRSSRGRRGSSSERGSTRDGGTSHAETCVKEATQVAVAVAVATKSDTDTKKQTKLPLRRVVRRRKVKKKAAPQDLSLEVRQLKAMLAQPAALASRTFLTEKNDFEIVEAAVERVTDKTTVEQATVEKTAETTAEAGNGESIEATAIVEADKVTLDTDNEASVEATVEAAGEAPFAATVKAAVEAVEAVVETTRRRRKKRRRLGLTDWPWQFEYAPAESQLSAPSLPPEMQPMPPQLSRNAFSVHARIVGTVDDDDADDYVDSDTNGDNDGDSDGVPDNCVDIDFDTGKCTYHSRGATKRTVKRAPLVNLLEQAYKRNIEVYPGFLTDMRKRLSNVLRVRHYCRLCGSVLCDPAEHANDGVVSPYGPGTLCREHLLMLREWRDGAKYREVPYPTRSV
ncbi:MAG: hypothetical protein MHM6MM_006036 [Cercozoa sp. M6MM]